MNEKFQKYRAAREAEIRESVTHCTRQVQVHKLAERIAELEAKILAVDSILGKEVFETVKFIARQEMKEDDNDVQA